MEQVFSARHPAEAHLVRGILEAHGIACEVRGEFLFGARGELPVTTETAPSVWILDSNQRDYALQIVEEMESDVPAETSAGKNGAVWICPNCGEDSEPQFTECWNCGMNKEYPEDSE